MDGINFTQLAEQIAAGSPNAALAAVEQRELDLAVASLGAPLPVDLYTALVVLCLVENDVPAAGHAARRLALSGGGGGPAAHASLPAPVLAMYHHARIGAYADLIAAAHDAARSASRDDLSVFLAACAASLVHANVLRTESTHHAVRIADTAAWLPDHADVAQQRGWVAQGPVYVIPPTAAGTGVDKRAFGVDRLSELTDFVIRLGTV